MFPSQGGIRRVKQHQLNSPCWSQDSVPQVPHVFGEDFRCITICLFLGWSIVWVMFSWNFLITRSSILSLRRRPQVTGMTWNQVPQIACKICATNICKCSVLLLFLFVVNSKGRSYRLLFLRIPFTQDYWTSDAIWIRFIPRKTHASTFCALVDQLLFLYGHKRKMFKHGICNILHNPIKPTLMFAYLSTMESSSLQVE